MPSGGAATNFSLATSESWKDKNTGQTQERTEWHKIVTFNRLAEIAAQYLQKGSKVYIEGSLRTKKWQDKDGQDKYTTEIIASDMQMLDSRSAQTSDPGPAQHQPPQGNASPAAPPAAGADFDDDMPF
jgi:single-strand DNA-binding protein